MKGLSHLQRRLLDQIKEDHRSYREFQARGDLREFLDRRQEMAQEYEEQLIKDGVNSLQARQEAVQQFMTWTPKVQSLEEQS